MVLEDSEYLGEASDEHLAWMLQAMEMVCTHIYVGKVRVLMCRLRKP
jgi:hypothetical protein